MLPESSSSDLVKSGMEVTVFTPSPMASNFLPRFSRAFDSIINSTSMLIPMSYYEHLSPQMKTTAILQGSGGCSWKVKIVRMDEEVYFGQGWEKFVEDNHLKGMEYLTFVYDGVHTFEVTIYGRDGCKEIRAGIEVDTEEDLHSVYSLSSSEEYKETRSAMDVDTEEDFVSDSVSEATATSVESEMEIKSTKGKTKISNPETYLDDPNNLFFETKLKKNKYLLLVPSQLVKDYSLKFPDRIDYIFKGGKLSANIANSYIKRWNQVCEKIKVKKDDPILCELLSTENVVHAIKIHVIRNKHA